MRVIWLIIGSSFWFLVSYGGQAQYGKQELNILDLPNELLQPILVSAISDDPLEKDDSLKKVDPLKQFANAYLNLLLVCKQFSGLLRDEAAQGMIVMKNQLIRGMSHTLSEALSTYKGSHFILSMLKIAHNPTATSKEDKGSFLCDAIKRGHNGSLIRTAIEEWGISPNDKTYGGFYPLVEAVSIPQEGQELFVSQLIKKYKAEVDVIGAFGITPLRRAIFTKNKKVVAVLLACNPDLKMGFDDIDIVVYARQCGDMEIVRMIEEHIKRTGAKIY